MLDNEQQSKEPNIDEEVVETQVEDIIEEPESSKKILEEILEEMAESADRKNAEELVEDMEETTDSEKKSFFGKKKDKKDKKDEQIEDLTDRLKRSMAEFENFRKRNEKEKQQMFETGARTIVEKILPTVDNFERGLLAVTEEEKASPFVEGMDKVYKQLMTSLEEIGVKQIEAEGAEFDPNLHNAVMHEENEELGENVVSAELQKGYTYRETVVRHSMVKVAN
ncbi:MAG: nucleotide exchange factor GrpE [Lachnotalea sp.]